MHQAHNLPLLTKVKTMDLLAIDTSRLDAVLRDPYVLIATFVSMLVIVWVAAILGNGPKAR